MPDLTFRRGMRLFRQSAGKTEFARVVEVKKGRVIVALHNGRETFPAAWNPGWRCYSWG
ncbi:MAG: hypothetical protein IJD04_04830 [Desulfovibrionaceae bacterium]|nr:hypothetical protein [Desulfovibrionaceae bacterium]